ncbi:MAG: flagellar filament capping protein FliD [Candidatus Poribacteria bacterium]|nr:flagellar filament capping protein FliD [Candidatus Poribacteria bacterium]
MAGFQVFGIASGLDTQSIIQQLVDLESRPLVLSREREANLTIKASLFQDFNTRLNGFRTNLRDLGDSIINKLSAISAVSGDETKFTASATTSANVGTFQIGVTQLAKQSTLMSLATNVTVADTDATLDTYGITSGTLSFTIDGTQTDVTVDASTDTLSTIRDKVNSAGGAVTASIINAGSSSTDYRIVFNGTQAGAQNAVELSETGTNFKSQLDLPTDDGSGRTPEQAATDSIITLGGVSISRTTNTISDVIGGVTLNLKNTTGTDVTLELKTDTATNLEKIQGFVDSLNSIREFMIEQTSFDEEATSQAVLYGDSTLIGIDQELRGALGRQLTTGGSITSLAQLGINFNTTTKQYEVNTSRVTDFLNDDPTSVRQLFIAMKESLTSVSNTGRLDRIVDAVDGTIKTKIDFLNSEIDTLHEAQTRMEERIERRRTSLEAQFRRLEQVMQEMQTQSQLFSSQIAGLQGLNSQSRSNS